MKKFFKNYKFILIKSEFKNICIFINLMISLEDIFLKILCWKQKLVISEDYNKIVIKLIEFIEKK